MSSRHPTFPDKESYEKFIVSQYESGKTMENIAQRIGVSKQAISYILNKNSVPKHSRKRVFIPDDVVQKVLQDAETHSYTEVAKMNGLAPWRTRLILKENDFSRATSLRYQQKVRLYRRILTSYQEKPDTYEEVAKRMGVSPMTVHRALKMFGSTVGTRYNDEAALEYAREIRRKGKTWPETARLLDRAGYKPARSDKWNPKVLREILERYERYGRIS